MQLSTGEIAQIATISTIIIAAIAVAIKTYVKTLSIPGRGEQSLIKMMHTELERMASQNALLSNEVGKLQVELLRLNSQLIALSMENQNLRSEILNLHNEVAGVQNLYKKGNT